MILIIKKNKIQYFLKYFYAKYSMFKTETNNTKINNNSSTDIF